MSEAGAKRKRAVKADSIVKQKTQEALETCKMLVESLRSKPALWQVEELSFLRDFLGGVH